MVLGPSGSGKTTLLNLIGSLDEATSGTVTVAGRRISDTKRRDLFEFRRHTVSFIFQSFNLFPGLTAAENVRFGADVAGARVDVGKLLDDVGLGERLDHFPHELSGGEQQRVAIARALATGNPILLADEPTGELDFRTGVQILELLRHQAETGMTVLVVTHNREISRVADRVIELSSGRKVERRPSEGRQGADLRSALVGGTMSRVWFWLRWAARDLRTRWQQVVAVALIVAVGTGVSAGVGSMTAWRQESYNESYALLHAHDIRVELPDGSSVSTGLLLEAVSRDWRDRGRGGTTDRADAGRRIGRGTDDPRPRAS